MSFTVTLNHVIIFESTSSRLPGRLRRHIDQIDADMDKGIQLGEIFNKQPDHFAKCQYIAMNLVNALEKKNINLVNLLSFYLQDRMPDLTEIKVTQDNDLFNLKLIN